MSRSFIVVALTLAQFILYLGGDLSSLASIGLLVLLLNESYGKSF